MREKNSIRRKIILTVFAVSIAALLVLGCATIVNIFVMRGQIVKTDTLLGETASQDSAAALEQETRSKLQTVSSYLGQLADEKMSGIRDYAVILSNIATGIFSNPDSYAPMDITQASDEYAGRVATFFTKPLLTPVESVIGEARLAANAGAYMRQMLAVDKSVLTCYISFMDGLHVVSDADAALRTAPDYDYNPASRGWFRDALARGEAGFTDITVDARGRGLGIVCSAPFHGADERPLGAVGIGVLIDEIDQLILSVSLGETGDAFVLNAQGEMIIGKGVKLTSDGKGFERPNVANASQDIAKLDMVNGESGIGRVDYLGREVYMAWYPIKSAGWTLAITMDVDEALALARATSEKIGAMSENSIKSVDRSIIISIVIVIAVLLVTALCVVLVGLRRARAITDPLKTLTQGVERISGGDLNMRIDIATGDEIEALAGSFNDMTGKLNEYIRNLTAVTAEKERIGAELDVAKKIQASMLPCIFPAFPERAEFEIYATMTPAKEVGGDFYDFFLVDDDHLAIVIADVSGKGVPAALFMVIAKTLIKNNALAGKPPAQAFTLANAQLCENNDAGMFVTGWMGLLTISTGDIVFANAGHNPPLIRRESGEYSYLRTRPGFVLAGMEGVKYRQYEDKLGPGDTLFLYTDGVTEATDAHNELYGEDRLQTILNANKKALPTRLLPLVKADIDAFVAEAPQFDDITMLGLRIIGRDEKAIVVPADDSRLSEVLEFVDAELDAHGYDAKSKIKIDIAVEELFVNVAHYAYPDKEGTVKIISTWKEKNQKIEFSFEDTGIPYDPLQKPDPDITLSAQERPIGGLGILMTKKTMDDFQYKYLEGRNITTIVKKR